MIGTKYITDITPIPDKLELTENFTDISDFDGIDAYVIGYSAIPKFYNLYNFNLSSTALSVEKVTTAEKTSFVWASNYSNSIVSRYNTFTLQSKSDYTNHFSCNYRLPNKLDCGNINTQAPVINILMVANITLPDGQAPSGVPMQPTTPIWSDTQNVSQFGGGDDTEAVLAELKNETDKVYEFHVYLYYYGIDHTFRVPYKNSNLRNGYLNFQLNESINGVTVRLEGYIFIGGIWLQGSRAFYESWETPSSMDGYPEIYPIVINGNYLIGSNFAGFFDPLIIDWSEGQPPTLRTSSGFRLQDEPNTSVGAFEELNIECDGTANTPLWYYWDYVDRRGNCICRNVSDSAERHIFVYPTISWADIETYISMFPRLSGLGAPIFDDNYEPTGEFSDDPEELQPWQSDITLNEYDGNIPNYQEDPEGEPTDINPGEIGILPKEDSGSIKTNSTPPGGFNAFTTNYILTEAQVTTFGQQLWQSVSDFTAYNGLLNFYTAGHVGTDTWYFSNADILNFIISLRWYPFDLTNTNIFGSDLITEIKLGTGIYPYPVAARIPKNPLYVVELGTFDFTKSDGKAGDSDNNTFLDLEPNVTMSLYVPFCGCIELQPSAIMGRVLSVRMHIDINTGVCTAYIILLDGNNEIPYAQISGTCGYDVLMTSNNAMTMSAKAMLTNSSHFIDNAVSYIHNASNFVQGGFLNNSSQGGSTGGSGKVDPINLINSGISYANAEIDRMATNVKHTLAQPMLYAPTPLITSTFSSISNVGYERPFILKRYHTAFNNGANYSSVGYICDQKKPIHSLKDGDYFECVNPKLENIPCTAEEAKIIMDTLCAGCFK